MENSIDYIDHPKEWESEDDFSSHRPALYMALINTTGDVTEIGSGYGSTYLLGKHCKENNRRFVSYETNWEWYQKINSLMDEHGIHSLVHLRDSYNSISSVSGLLFIDCAPAEIRKDLINKFRDEADVIVVHDTEDGAEYVYGLRNILNTFAYRLDYHPKGNPSTTILSNKIDLSKWTNLLLTSSTTPGGKKNMNLL